MATDPRILEYNRKWYRAKQNANPAAYLISRATRDPSRLYVELKAEDVHVPSHCPCCGVKMEFGRPVENSPTLDRIDNAVHYVRGNVIVVCYRCNRAKGDLSVKELVRLATFYSNLISGNVPENDTPACAGTGG